MASTLPGNQRFDFFNHEEGRHGFGIAVAALEKFRIAGGFAFKNLPDSARFGLIFHQRRVGCALGFPANFFSLGLGGDFNLAFFDFLLHHLFGRQALLFRSRYWALLNLHQPRRAWRHSPSLSALACLMASCALASAISALGRVFAGDGLGFLLMDKDPLVGLGLLHALFGLGEIFGDLDLPVPVGLGLADGRGGFLLPAQRRARSASAVLLAFFGLRRGFRPP